MTTVRHVVCKAEVTLNRALAGVEPSYLIFWCPSCRRAVSEKELDVAGPYCAATTEPEKLS